MGALTFLCRWSSEGGKNIIVLDGARNTSAVIVLRGVLVPTSGGCTRLAIIMGHMMVVIAPAD